jgi:hypothetical protein
MALSREQQELLGALADGQCEGHEQHAAAELAATPEGGAYLRDLNALRALVRAHGAARAPVGLPARVLAAVGDDFDDISRPTGSLLPLRRVLWLAAACAVVAFGVYFAVPGGAPAPGPQVSREMPPPAPLFAPPPALDPPGQPVPSPSGPPVVESATGPTQAGPANHARGTVTVLNLDRGNGDDQVSIELARGGRNPLQAYHELLAVVCLHGDARLVDAESQDTAADNDFSALDGLEVELPADAVPELLAAIRKLSLDQQLGAVQVPEDLERPVSDTEQLVRDLAEATREAAREEDQDGSARRIQGYLPSAVLSEARANADRFTGGGGGEAGEAGKRFGRKDGLNRPAQEHKVKLVIRLQ